MSINFAFTTTRSNCVWPAESATCYFRRAERIGRRTCKVLRTENGTKLPTIEHISFKRDPSDDMGKEFASPNHRCCRSFIPVKVPLRTHCGMEASIYEFCVELNTSDSAGSQTGSRGKSLEQVKKTGVRVHLTAAL